MDREYAHPADIARARHEVVEVCRLMHQRGYIAAGDGNVSVRIGENKLLVTPSGARKGFLKPEDLVLCTLDGTPLKGEKRRPSSELAMHVQVYSLRPEVGAVVHAHPPVAIAHTVVGIGLPALLPEVFCELGEIVVVPYSTPTTEEVPRALAGPLAAGRVALIMERHGSITLGATLAKAYDRLEVLEHTARISLYAHSLSPRVEPMGAPQLDKLRQFLGCGLMT